MWLTHLKTPKVSKKKLIRENLVPFIFKKHEKHRWRSDTFGKVAD